MKRSTAAVLLSALVFPGAGQCYLRRYARAALFALPSALGVAYLVRAAIDRADAIVTQMQAGTLALDPELIAAQISAQSSNTDTLVNMLMLLCWIGSIVDAYLLARAESH